MVKYTNYYRKSKQITISINPTCDTQTESKKQNNTQKEKNHTGVSTFNTNQHRTWKKYENNWRKNHESKSINLTTLISVSTNFPNPIILWKVKTDESWLIFNYNSIIRLCLKLSWWNDVYLVICKLISNYTQFNNL